MLQKNNGYVLVFTVVIFFIVNIVAITCSELVLSNSKYTKYTYKDVYMKEQCLSSIEFVYSNMLHELDVILKKSKNNEEYQENFIDSNLSNDFINRVSTLDLDELKNVRCVIKEDNDNNLSSDYFYYKIYSYYEDKYFDKCIIANVRIKKELENNKDISSKANDLIEITNYIGG